MKEISMGDEVFDDSNALYTKAVCVVKESAEDVVDELIQLADKHDLDVHWVIDEFATVFRRTANKKLE